MPELKAEPSEGDHPAWEPHVRLDVSPPRLAMRRKIGGLWEYRDPTPPEEDDYVSATAW